MIPVRDTFNDYASRVEAELRATGFRVNADVRHEDMRAKIHDASLEKLPYLLIVGEKEAASGTVAVRDESIKDMKARNVGTFPLSEVIRRFEEEVREKRIREVSKASAAMGDGAAKFEA